MTQNQSSVANYIVDMLRHYGQIIKYVGSTGYHGKNMNADKIKKFVWKSSVVGGHIGALTIGIASGVTLGAEAMKHVNIHTKYPYIVNKLFELMFCLTITASGFAGGVILGGVYGMLWPITLWQIYAIEEEAHRRYVEEAHRRTQMMIEEHKNGNNYTRDDNRYPWD